MKRDENVYLQHIMDALCRIERYVGETSYDDFMRDELLQAGVIREFEIIGEAAKKITSDM